MLSQVRPSPKERERLRLISREIIAKIERLAEERGMVLQAMLVGSAARDTWLAQDHDLDIFLGVPENSDLSEAMELATFTCSGGSSGENCEKSIEASPM